MYYNAFCQNHSEKYSKQKQECQTVKLIRLLCGIALFAALSVGGAEVNSNVDNSGKVKTKADSSAAEIKSCRNAGKQFFYCESGNQEFILCGVNEETLLFENYRNKKLQSKYRGTIANDFKREVYSRAMVSSNTIKFSDGNTEYEIYKYNNEEDKSSIIDRYGVLIKMQNKDPQEIICKKAKSDLSGAVEVVTPSEY
ncbi:MAG: hypothetical protein D6B27_07325 [Gammaproteobacteria bacterium]|nr:MAG: hypothetical protein D6B27_07325 [Gammaproteobacteria bacterium]